MNSVSLSVVRIIVCLILVAGIAGIDIRVSAAQTNEVPQTTRALTQLQYLVTMLQKLQMQLAQLQSAEPSATVAAMATSSATSTAYDIVIVAGQSNAVGFGEGSYTEDAKYTTAENKAKVFQLGRCATHAMQIIPVVNEPLEFWGRGSNCNRTTSKMYGSAYPFALRLAATEPAGRKVLIIPAAKGGTSILQWDKVINNFASSTDTTLLYDDMASRTKAVLAQNPHNRIVAVIWRQGEADAIALHDSASQYHPLMSTSTYQFKLTALRYHLRHDFPAQGCFPFIFGEMTKQWVPGVADKNAITSVIQYVATHDGCSTTSNQSVFVPSDTTMTTNYNEPIHFNAAGQWAMAKKMWAAFQQF